MLVNLGLNKMLWLIIGLLSLIAALAGVLSPGIYDGIVSEEILPGVMSQDLITILAAVVLLFFAVRVKEKDAKIQIIALGILGYLFYAYGIYVIERFYNVLYFLYMAVFALSFYSLIYGVLNIQPEVRQKVKQSELIRKVAVVFSLLIPVLFYILWVSQILPLIQAGQRIEYMYSIYIMDMCFLFPAFIIIAIKAAKRDGLGLLLVPVIFINGFTLLFSVALGAILKPLLYQQAGNTGEIWLYLSVSLLFLVLAAVYFRKLTIDR